MYGLSLHLREDSRRRPGMERGNFHPGRRRATVSTVGVTDLCGPPGRHCRRRGADAKRNLERYPCAHVRLPPIAATMCPVWKRGLDVLA
jgi:hypothetical protein